jgi:large subunit ribosomal protein L24
MANKLHVHRDDTVVVITGKDSGKIGKVLHAYPAEGKVSVEKVNVVSRHTKPRGQQTPGGIIKSERAIDASNVMLYCEKCKKATRIQVKVQAGKRVRVCKHCGAELG